MKELIEVVSKYMSAWWHT